MPNAETHLTAACDLLVEPDIAQAFPWLSGEASHAAFLMGSISPDVRAIGRQTREETHFFTIPPADNRPAPAVMCADWPQIADPNRISAAHAAFIAGYMIHLIMDQTWVEMIVLPGLYIAGTPWDPSHPNWRLYCILMTYLEYRAAGRMPSASTWRLAAARPEGWLPFAADADLAVWRDLVARVINGGGPRLVSRPLVESCGLSLDEMESIVLSEAEMAREAYPTISHAQLLEFEAETARRSRAQVIAYLSGATNVFS
jgi:hypothetical protein